MKKYIIIICTALSLIQCNVKEEEEDFNPYSKKTEKEKEKEKKDPEKANSEKEFIWKAMNSWYLWNSDIPKLNDDFAKEESFKSFLEGPESSKDFFISLFSTKDRFSIMLNDGKIMRPGNNKTFGLNIQDHWLKIDPNGGTADSNYTLGMIIRSVHNNSTAKGAGIVRGDRVIGLNGKLFTDPNDIGGEAKYYKIKKDYDTMETIEFMFGERDGKTVTKKITLTKEDLEEESILAKKIFDVNGEKVPYLAYGSFLSSQVKQLNNTFSEFKSVNPRNFILDLRYNSGGAISTCAQLASLIYGEGNTTDTFLHYRWNAKHPEEEKPVNFFDGIPTYDNKGDYIQGGDIPLNRLTGIQTLYVFVTPQTASSSEMLIHGLRPYMNIKVIGRKKGTVGKNVGSIFLFDSPETNYIKDTNINKNHNIVLQPIVLKVFDKNDETYVNIIPDVQGSDFFPPEGILPFGNENENYTNYVIVDIQGASPRLTNDHEDTKNNYHQSTKQEQYKPGKMYFEPNYLNKILSKKNN